MSNDKKDLAGILFPELEKQWNTFFPKNDFSNVFDLKPIQSPTLKTIIQDNCIDLWNREQQEVNKAEPAVISKIIEAEIKDGTNEFIWEGLTLGGDGHEFSLALLDLTERLPDDPLSKLVLKSLSAYAQDSIEAEKDYVAQCYLDEELAWEAEEHRYDPPWEEEE